MTWGGPAGVALVAVAVAMGVHGWGPAVLGLAALAWVLATPEGNLADRLLSYVFSAMAAVIVLGLAGPAVPSIFGPGGLAAAVTAPPAVAVARRGVRRPSLRGALWPDAAAIGAVATVCGWLFWRPFHHGAPARLLTTMMLGGTDYLAHFDYFQNAWWHHGFPFVLPHHAILEPRPGLAATPYGAHVAMAGVAMLLSGHAALPSTGTALRDFAGCYVAAGVLFVSVLCAVAARLLVASGVPPAVRVAAVVFVGVTTATGVFAALYTEGFLTYMVGVAATLFGMAVAVVPSRLRWRDQAGLLTIAVLVGSFVYTLTVPVLLLAVAAFVIRTAATWRRRIRPAATWAIGLAVIITGSVVPTLPSLHALDDTGGIAPINFMLPVATTALVAYLSRRAGERLPRFAAQLAWLAVATGLLVVLLAAEELLVSGQVRYYATKLAYLWLALAMLALLVQLGGLAADTTSRDTSRGRAAMAALAAGCLIWCAVDSAHVPRAISFAFPRQLDAVPYDHDSAVARDVVEVSESPGLRLRLLWGPRISSVPNRWIAILRRQWTATEDSLFLQVGSTDRFATSRLELWLRAHPGDDVELFAENHRWQGYASIAAVGRHDVAVGVAP